MDRRSFLRKLGIGAAGSAALAATQLPGLDYDPERALWTPGRKAIFIPPAPTPAPTYISRQILAHQRAYAPILDMQRYGMSNILYLVRNDKTNWQEKRFVGGVPEKYISQHGDVTRWRMSRAEPVGAAALPELFSESRAGQEFADAEKQYWRGRGDPVLRDRLIREEFASKGIYDISTDSWNRADGTIRDGATSTAAIVGRWRK